MVNTNFLAGKLAANAEDLAAVLTILYPGRSKAASEFRDQLLHFCQNLLAKNLLLIGPSGSGKSAIARIVALIRYLFLIKHQSRRSVLEVLTFDGPMRISKFLLDWYEEINVAALSPDAIESQLFGTAADAFTNVRERPGLFEAASNGHIPERQNLTLGARLTNGVVLLDEITELPLELQPKLLSVLTGADVFRVGGEGNPKWQFNFRGTTVSATWKNAGDSSLLRPDLKARISDYIIRMPSLDERPEDLPEIVNFAIAESRYRIDVEVARVLALETVDVDQAVVQSLANRQRSQLRDSDIKRLAVQSWGDKGELRGLRQVIQRLLDGMCLDEALALQAMEAAVPLDQAISAIATETLQVICDSGPPSSTYTEMMGKIEQEVRVKAREMLLAKPDQLSRLAKRLRISPSEFKEELTNSARLRKKKRQNRH